MKHGNQSLFYCRLTDINTHHYKNDKHFSAHLENDIITEIFHSRSSFFNLTNDDKWKKLIFLKLLCGRKHVAMIRCTRTNQYCEGQLQYLGHMTSRQ